VLTSGTLSQTLNLTIFLLFRTCCQLSWTADRCQFISLSVHLCLQHYGCDAGRRAGFGAGLSASDLLTLWVV